MKSYYAIFSIVFIFVVYIPLLPLAAVADETGDRWQLQFSPYTLHFDPDEEHDDVWLVGLEWESANNWLAGGAYFENSFGQPSWFWYGGYRWDGSKILEGTYAKVAAGILVGYDEPYEDKIPVNWDGVGIGVLPAVGWQYKKLQLQMNLLGLSGLMMMLNMDISP